MSKFITLSEYSCSCMMPKKDYEKLTDFWNIFGESKSLFKMSGEREPTASITITYDNTGFNFNIRSFNNESYGVYYIAYTRFPGFKPFQISSTYNIEQICKTIEYWISTEINKY